MSENASSVEENNRDCKSENKNSVLTDLLEINHLQTIRHFFYALLAVLILKDVIAFRTKEVTFGLRMFVIGFENLHRAFILWSAMFALHLLTFPIFRSWMWLRQEMSFTTTFKHSWDLIALIMLVMYDIGSLYYVPIFVHKFNIGLIASTVVNLENLRLLMKTHSFVRNNVPKVLRSQRNSEQNPYAPRLSNFLYFSFAPTFIYEDKYPRTKRRNIRFASKCFIDLLFCIWLLGFVCDTLIPSLHQNAGMVEINLTEVAICVFDTFLEGLFVFLSLFYMIYQCWLNITGELLTFENRNFYEAWWTSTDYGVFFRTWNAVVQKWLYVYIYKEFKENVTPKSKWAPKITVLFISALAHEYVISCVLKQFFPVMFVLFFIIAAPLTFLNVKHRFFNVYFIIGLGLWTSTIFNLSILEYNANFNCPTPETNETLLKYLPRALTADCFLQ